MAKLVLMFILISGFGFSQYLKLNSNPEDPGRMPDPETEIGIILSQDSPVLSIGGGGGKISKGRLSAGTLVIANRTTGNANWIAICGNTNHTPWKPRGKIVYFKEEDSYQLECGDMLVRLEKLQIGMDKLQDGVDILLSRDYAGTLIELRQMIKNLQDSLASQSNPVDLEKEITGTWSTNKIVAIAIGTAIGGLSGSFIKFPEKEERWKQTRGKTNGEWYYGPMRPFTVNIYVGNNPYAIVGGAVLGGLLTWGIIELLE